MTVGQQRVWDTHWGELGRKLEELPAGEVDLAGWFGREASVVLEIGSGMGDATAQLAARAPDVNHLAAEVYPAGLGQLMLWVEKYELENVRLLHGDALDFLRDHLPPDSLAGVRVFFPDPWPKKRHHKRRLITPRFVALLASRLAPGGRLHLATDWQDYAERMLAICTAEPLLRNEYDGWAPRPDWRPITKFESRAHAEGRICHDLMFTKAA
ncbi:tRNA (guanine-N7-)-methyltransferase [Kribbella orskensis]|uniref:tRNA (guanine-N(7)-)-methyltransferase n=1 Tax=Kribbella orskensis TaxID=2512216 RepID=A0ABY2BVW4_9ACTN|nr:MULTISPECIES: tRNA (guanosine(46)-N7)-methyltransferase TrmB [Kribbella]TCN42686.1 tRNA (guanine-N7-)-methyltransferase [Kribbella sp. VKM Ac-2500]TCO29958.1 tRNA (guanine-N7-)-methyltransferase [Kribbella orskensis]